MHGQQLWCIPILNPKNLILNLFLKILNLKIQINGLAQFESIAII
jgi:hypothetical protein